MGYLPQLPYIKGIFASLEGRNSLVVQREAGRLPWLLVGLLITCIAAGVLVYHTRRDLLGLPVPPIHHPPVHTNQPVQNTEEQELESIYEDIDTSHPYAEAIEWVKEEQVFPELDGDVFGPELPLQRNRFLQIVVDRTAEVDPTTVTQRSGHLDVSPDEWVVPYVRYGRLYNILPEETLFRPTAAITVAEAQEMLQAAYQLDAIDTSSLANPQVAASELLTRQDAAQLLWIIEN